jgi:hypothetical protein
MLLISRHTSLSSLMRDPKKQKPEALRKNMAAAATALGSHTSIATSSSGGINTMLHEQGSVIHTPDMHRQGQSIDSYVYYNELY